MLREKRRFSEEIMHNRKFRKEICKRCRLRNKFCKDPSKENELLFKTQRNKYVSLWRKCIKSYFQDVPKKDLVTNNSFWSFVKPFLTNKSCHTQNDIIVIDKGKVIVEESVLTEKFNDYCINIVQNLRDKNLATLFLTQIHWKMTWSLTK